MWLRMEYKMTRVSINTNEPTATLRAGLHYGGEGLRSVKNAWPRHGYIRQMVDICAGEKLKAIKYFY
jgi:hypothetical protein